MKFIIGKALGLGKGYVEMVKRLHCHPESSHHLRELGRKTTAKHRIFKRDESVVQTQEERIKGQSVP